MTIKAKVSLAFIKEQNASDKVTTGNGFINGFTTYKDKFPNPPVTIDDFTVLTKQLSSDKTAADTGLYSARKALDKTVKLWDDAARKLCNYVSDLANGDEQMIEEAGMKSTKTETTLTHAPGENKALVVTPETAKGAVTVETDIPAATATVAVAATKGMVITQDHGNLVITTPNGDTATIIVDTHHTLHYENLQSNVPVTIYVYGVNLAGSGPLSGGQNVTPQ